MFKDIKEANLQDKTVLLRVDYNVPIQDNKILDDTKIKASLKTINYLLENNCRIIVLSHLGKIKSAKDKEKYSLEIVAKRLNELVNTQVIFSRYTRSPELDLKVKTLNPKEILVLENTRFEDYPNKLESNCDLELAEYWASLGDLFVMDAFATSHRRHASTYGIAQYIPAVCGFLVEEELRIFDKVLTNPEHPFVAILGGAKVSDKLPVIENLIDKVDTILIGGGMAYTFIKAIGGNVGMSIVDNSKLDLAKEIYERAKEKGVKIILPIDNIGAKEFSEDAESKLFNSGFISDDYQGMDIGPKTIKTFKKEIKHIFMPAVSNIYINEEYAEFVDAAAASEAEISYCEYGAGAVGEDYFFTFLSPSSPDDPKGYYAALDKSATEENMLNASAVIWLEYCGTSFAFTSSAGKAALESIVDSYDIMTAAGDEYAPIHGYPIDLSGCDIVSVPGHGRAECSSPKWYQTLSPSLAVISVGDNYSGYPSAQALADISSVVNFPILTSKHGDITIIVDKDGYTLGGGNNK